jgi:hypothetical protein
VPASPHSSSPSPARALPRRRPGRRREAIAVLESMERVAPDDPLAWHERRLFQSPLETSLSQRARALLPELDKALLSPRSNC